MARKSSSTKSAPKGAAKTRKARAGTPKATKAAAKPVEVVGGVPVIKDLTQVGANTPLGKVVAKVGHMRSGGPDADTYFGLPEKGGKPIYAIKKTGQRSGSGERGTRHQVTLHSVDASGKLSKPLAAAKSVRAGWVFSS